MDKSFLQIDYSGWWILLILVVAAALSYFLYSKKDVPWNATQNWALATVRFLAITSLLLLFLTPSLRQITNYVDKPVVAIALDNSQSVVARGAGAANLTRSFQNLKEALQNQGLEPLMITFNDSDSFNVSTSNLSNLIKKVEEATENQHLAGIVLASDGIYNRGSSPVYKNHISPFFTVGLGDSIPPKDISISRTLYNKITYKGNETPIRLEISQEGYDNKLVNVELREKGQLIGEKSIRLRSSIQEVEFVLKSENEGLRHLVATIPENPEESTTENNRSNIFMEVIDARQRVLIVANSPHPDIKAIRNTLASTGNYQTDLYIPEIHDEKPNEIYDVVIFHGAFTSGISYSPKENPGKWYILSNESSVTSSNKSLPYLKIERRGSQPDKVVGSFNQNFSKFKIEDVSAFEEYPPIQVPFGEYTITGPTEILMYQKLGSVTTQKPLMAIYDDGATKSAVLVGQNIWQWKLQEAAINDNSNQFDNLITKTVQFLSVKNDKKQFRFTIRKRNLTDAEPPHFDVEVYNDIYERIYNNEISISITSEENVSENFNFTDSEYNSTFRAPTFPSGIYQYTAQVKVGDKTLTDRGEFSVQNINPEFLNLTADHQLLKNLAQKTGGSFVHLNELDQLPRIIEEKEFKAKIRSEEELIPLYKAWWWYLIIFMLFSTEWFLRKYWGGY
ncbi:hypothetical protein SAMN05421640_0835 [Ekhidna lutea]|uniref:VWA domain-containing protein n=1 Tax=Ekhidna lutea TaxID=447679 RepID=A0A239FXF1_EKHLU|nr:hypothetical protein [Ekhidna lutea]SNS60454.1 hypothetical protein SAMN05421640_0835 [Ekhidna lutea]